MAKLTDEDVSKQRKLNQGEIPDKPAIVCINEHYESNLNDMLFDLASYGKVEGASRALDALDDEYTLVLTRYLASDIQRSRDDLDKLADDIDGELTGCIDCLEQVEPDIDQVINYLKGFKSRTEKAFRSIDTALDRITNQD